MNIQSGVGLHNKFDFHVVKGTGEVEDYTSYNVILDQGLTYLAGGVTSWFNVISFGEGTGELSEDRTALFSQIASITATAVDSGVLTDEPGRRTGWVSKQITLVEGNSYVGRSISEVGIRTSINNGTLLTHSQILDSEGGAVSITIGATDTITITAIVYWAFNYPVNGTLLETPVLQSFLQGSTISTGVDTGLVGISFSEQIIGDEDGYWEKMSVNSATATGSTSGTTRSYYRRLDSDTFSGMSVNSVFIANTFVINISKDNFPDISYPLVNELIPIGIYDGIEDAYELPGEYIDLSSVKVFGATALSTEAAWRDQEYNFGDLVSGINTGRLYSSANPFEDRFLEGYYGNARFYLETSHDYLSFKSLKEAAEYGSFKRSIRYGGNYNSLILSTISNQGQLVTVTAQYTPVDIYRSESDFFISKSTSFIEVYDLKEEITLNRVEYDTSTWLLSWDDFLFISRWENSIAYIDIYKYRRNSITLEVEKILFQTLELPDVTVINTPSIKETANGLLIYYQSNSSTATISSISNYIIRRNPNTLYFEVILSGGTLQLEDDLIQKIQIENSIDYSEGVTLRHSFILTDEEIWVLAVGGGVFKINLETSKGEDWYLYETSYSTLYIYSSDDRYYLSDTGTSAVNRRQEIVLTPTPIFNYISDFSLNEDQSSYTVTVRVSTDGRMESFTISNKDGSTTRFTKGIVLSTGEKFEYDQTSTSLSYSRYLYLLNGEPVIFGVLLNGVGILLNTKGQKISEELESYTSMSTTGSFVKNFYASGSSYTDDVYLFKKTGALVRVDTSNLSVGSPIYATYNSTSYCKQADHIVDVSYSISYDRWDVDPEDLK